MVHLIQPRQPLERRIELAAPSHFPRRPYPFAVGVHPQADQQLRIKRRPPTFFHAALDALVEPAQIQSPSSAQIARAGWSSPINFSTSTARQLIPPCQSDIKLMKYP